MDTIMLITCIAILIIIRNGSIIRIRDAFIIICKATFLIICNATERSRNYVLARANLTNGVAAITIYDEESKSTNSSSTTTTLDELDASDDSWTEVPAKKASRPPQVQAATFQLPVSNKFAVLSDEPSESHLLAARNSLHQCSTGTNALSVRTKPSLSNCIFQQCRRSGTGLMRKADRTSVTCRTTALPMAFRAASANDPEDYSNPLLPLVAKYRFFPLETISSILSALLLTTCFQSSMITPLILLLTRIRSD